MDNVFIELNTNLVLKNELTNGFLLELLTDPQAGIIIRGKVVKYFHVSARHPINYLLKAS
jgi:hypothetical protein